MMRPPVHSTNIPDRPLNPPADDDHDWEAIENAGLTTSGLWETIDEVIDNIEDEARSRGLDVSQSDLGEVHDTLTGLRSNYKPKKENIG